MSKPFRIEINHEDLRRVEEVFADCKKIGRKVTARALNKTLTGVRTDASEAVRNVITAKKKAVDQSFKIQRASGDSMSAAIASTGRPIPLIDYRHGRQTRQGVRIQVRKSAGYKLWPSSFIAQMKSDHEGIFQRVDEGYQGRYRGKYVKKPRNPRKKILTQRLQIKELRGPRAPDILGNDRVLGPVIKSAQERLHKNLLHEINYEMSKM